MVGNGDVVFFYKNHLINFICGKENERGGENEAQNRLGLALALAKIYYRHQIKYAI